MDKYNILECTLRDGGYITGWKFEDSMIRDTIASLIRSHMDLVEVGYLNAKSVGNTVDITITFDVQNSEQLQNVIRSIMKLDSVVAVERSNQV